MTERPRGSDEATRRPRGDISAPRTEEKQASPRSGKVVIAEVLLGIILAGAFLSWWLSQGRSPQPGQSTPFCKPLRKDIQFTSPTQIQVRGTIQNLAADGPISVTATLTTSKGKLTKTSEKRVGHDEIADFIFIFPAEAGDRTAIGDLSCAP